MVKSELIKSIDISVVRKINEQKAKKIRAFPFKENKTEIYIYTSSNKQSMIDEFEFIFRKKVEVITVTEEEFEYLLKIVYLGNRKDADYEVFKEAINLKASDIHFEPYKDSNIQIQVSSLALCVFSNVDSMYYHLYCHSTPYSPKSQVWFLQILLSTF